MVRTTCHTLTNYQASDIPRRCGDARAWLRTLLPLRWRHIPSPRDAALAREDGLHEAAISLSLRDGLPFAGGEYRLLELLQRIDP
jgi:hypothetical protein